MSRFLGRYVQPEITWEVEDNLKEVCSEDAELERIMQVNNKILRKNASSMFTFLNREICRATCSTQKRYGLMFFKKLRTAADKHLSIYSLFIVIKSVPEPSMLYKKGEIFRLLFKVSRVKGLFTYYIQYASNRTVMNKTMKDAFTTSKLIRTKRRCENWYQSLCPSLVK